MMSLIARDLRICHLRRQKVSGKRSYGNEDVWSVKVEREDRTGQPVVGSDPKTVPDFYDEQSTESSFSARYSKCDNNKVRSSLEWKVGPPIGDRTIRRDLLGEKYTSRNEVSFMKRPSTMEQRNPLNEGKPRDRTGPTRCVVSK